MLDHSASVRAGSATAGASSSMQPLRRRTWRRVRNAIERREHVAPLRVDPARDERARVERPARQLGVRLERRDAHDAAACSTSASPWIVAMPIRRPVNDPGPTATANTSTDEQRHAERCQFARQAFAVRARRIALPFAHDPAVLDERHASRRVPLCQEPSHACDRL